MSRFFTSLGRFVVRFRFLVVVAWILMTFLAVRFLPSLGDVAKDTTSGFLPAGSPSMQAATLAAPFQDSSLAAATLVVARDGGLTAEDNAAVDRLETSVRAVDRVKAVVDFGVSRDGVARQALVQAEVVAFTGGPEAKGVVDAIRSTFTAVGAPAGLQIHLTGQLATAVDTVAASGSSQNSTQELSLLFIVVLLVLAFRALLAPIVTLLPAVFVLILAGPVIAESTKVGVQVSSITQLLLIVLILGAGTDYGVFLVFRVREELRRGLTPHEAVIHSVSRVGESITFSAFTVIVALVSLVIAEFAFYQSLGPALAIGIALMLLAGLTLLPALLAIFGRAVFWPTGAKAQPQGRAGLWDRIGVVATRRPGITLAAGIVLFVSLGATLLMTGVAGFGDASASPAGTDSGDGSALIAEHFPSSTAGRSAVLMQFPTSVWDHPGVLAIAQNGLTGLAEFSGLVGPLNPNGIPLTTDQLTQLHTTLGPARALPPVPATTAVPADLYNAYRASGQLISPDGRTIQFSVEYAHGDASTPAVIDAVPAMRADVDRVAQAAGATANGVFGQVAFAYDVSHISGTDLSRIIPIVAVLIALLLAIVLRSLVAPIYLVASIVLSYLASLGLVGIVFVHLGGQDGLNFILPFLMFVFLMALGSDYNILIMSRIREEAHDLPLRDAVALAIGRTGSTITTAGMILGGSFAVLAIAGGSSGGGQIQQIGYGVAAGVLLDTFLLRSLLVPSLVVLLGALELVAITAGGAGARGPTGSTVPGARSGRGRELASPAVHAPAASPPAVESTRFEAQSGLRHASPRFAAMSRYRKTVLFSSLLALLVAACGNSAVTTSTAAQPTAAPTQAPTAAPATTPTSTPPPAGSPGASFNDGSTPAPAAQLAGVTDLGTVMPAVLAGKNLSKTQFEGADFAASPASVSQQMVDLLKALGRTPGDLTMAIASVTPGAVDPSITAFRVKGVKADAFLAVYLPLITSAVPGTQVSKGILAGKAVWLVTGTPSAPPSYLVPRDDVLFAVLAGDRSVALEAISDLP